MSEKRKHNTPKPMRLGENGAKGEIYNYKCLH